MGVFSKPPQNEANWETVFPDEDKDLLPEGNQYIGKCTNVVKGIAKSSGNPKYTFSFVIVKGPYAGRDFDLDCAVTEAAMWKLGETLRALGVSGQSGEKVKWSRAACVGVMVLLDIYTDTYQGRKRSKIRSLLAHPNGAGYRTK